MAKKPQPEPERPAPQLYLVTPPVADAEAFAHTLKTALGAADIAAVLLRLAPGGESELVGRIKHLALVAEQGGAALVLEEPEFGTRVTVTCPLLLLPSEKGNDRPAKPKPLRSS